jgi:hypothetical protein
MKGSKAVCQMNASSLLEKHHGLLVLIDHLEGSLSQLARNPAQPAELRGRVLSILLQLNTELADHFETESRSLEEDFDDAPDLREAFRNLDREHPVILNEFGEAVGDLGRAVPLQEIVPTLRSAIARFRAHEAREELLFKAGT